MDLTAGRASVLSLASGKGRPAVYADRAMALLSKKDEQWPAAGS